MTWTSAGLVLVPALACVNTGRLAEFDFHDRTLAVTATSPADPSLATPDAEIEGGWLQSLFNIGAGIARATMEQGVGERLLEAAANVDVPARTASRVLSGAATVLGMHPVEDSATADFLFDVRVTRYGIDAEDDSTAVAFVLTARLSLTERETGAEIWSGGIEEREEAGSGFFSDATGVVATMATLRGLTVEEMEEALRGLADYSADLMVEKLAKSVAKAEEDGT